MYCPPWKIYKKKKKIKIKLQYRARYACIFFSSTNYSSRTKLSYSRAINDPNQETSARNATGNFPILETGEPILDDTANDRGEGHSGADSQDEQHEEEEHGE